MTTMTLLAPAALIGLLLLGIPIMAHLFKPRKTRPTPFSSLRWLRLTHQRLSRRVQWHQWLLFLLRAGFVLALVLALAKPLLDFSGAANPVDRVIVIDTGGSMGYAAKDLDTPLERAVAVAERLAAQPRPGDRAAVIVAGTSPRLLAPLSADASACLPLLRDLKPLGGDAPVSGVLPLLPSLLPSSSRELELVFLTTNLRTSWQPGDVQGLAKALPGKIRVQVVDVGPGSPRNAWIAGARLLPHEPGEDRVVRVEIGCVGDGPTDRRLRFAVDGLADDARAARLAPGQAGIVDFKIPANAPLVGQVARISLEPADSLASDDVYFIPLDAPWALRLLLIEPERDDAEAAGPGLFLRSVVESLNATGSHALKLTTRSSRSATAQDVAAADIVLLAGLAELPVVEALEKQVEAGAGLIVFLNQRLDTPLYQEQLTRPVQPSKALLPLLIPAGKDAVKHAAGGRLGEIRWSHPLLAPLRDPLLGDLPQTTFRAYAAWKATKEAAVLARFGDGVPALVERGYGAGRVLAWNTTADVSWSDLPRRRSFVPLVDRMLAHLSAGGSRRQFLAGEPVTLPLHDAPADGWTLHPPDGPPRPVAVQRRGGRAFAQLDDLREPGVYRVERGGQRLVVAVNTSRDASALTPMDAATLAAWWQPAEVEIVSADAMTQRLSEAAKPWPVWPALVLLGSLLLLAETVYVYRLCPRSQPVVVDSVVAGGSVMKPTTESPPK